ncbi:2-oxoacid:acceptor oxidoreductase family protein [Carboxydothermus ferrireducens]|uniref:Indolepyruvate ferredoxin oxidoreductase beta subunit n=1 Tax=Carboxydothermus ferrireducens DSM 11255 TaxID=1119529 RepID=A0ABX2R6R0_9THEO|nr:2-oxoacid:acceptor oxidoreductase family protein [Carboxydothermus ferrireducens]NYE56760.1 indolepyruvate ferredoxin oxidoreductase beta subunit [Carboxydothermus ferrireducens DSM 11255]
MNVMIAGVGGQGAVLVTRLLGEALARSGKKVLATESLGMAQRGGSVVSFLRIEEEGGPLPGEESIDFLLALELVEGLRNISYLKSEGKAVAFGKVIYPPGIGEKDFSVLKLRLPPQMKVFLEEEVLKFISDLKTINIFFLGILVKNTYPDLASEVLKVMEQVINPRKLEANVKSFWQGYNFNG